MDKGFKVPRPVSVLSSHAIGGWETESGVWLSWETRRVCRAVAGIAAPRDTHVSPGLVRVSRPSPVASVPSAWPWAHRNQRARRLVVGKNRGHYWRELACQWLIFNSFLGAWLSNSPLSLWLEGIMLWFFSLLRQGRALLAFPFWSATLGTHWTFSSALKASSCQTSVCKVVQRMQF